MRSAEGLRSIVKVVFGDELAQTIHHLKVDGDCDSTQAPTQTSLISLVAGDVAQRSKFVLRPPPAGSIFTLRMGEFSVARRNYVQDSSQCAIFGHVFGELLAFRLTLVWSSFTFHREANRPPVGSPELF